MLFLSNSPLVQATHADIEKLKQNIIDIAVNDTIQKTELTIKVVEGIISKLIEATGSAFAKTNDD